MANTQKIKPQAIFKITLQSEFLSQQSESLEEPDCPNKCTQVQNLNLNQEASNVERNMILLCTFLHKIANEANWQIKY